MEINLLFELDVLDDLFVFGIFEIFSVCSNEVAKFYEKFLVIAGILDSFFNGRTLLTGRLTLNFDI